MSKFRILSWTLITSLFFFLVCCDEEKVDPIPNDISFGQAGATLTEGQQIEVVINLSRAADVDGVISILVSKSSSASYGNDYVTTPTMVKDTIQVNFGKSQVSTSFIIATQLDDQFEDAELVELTIVKAPNGFTIELGSDEFLLEIDNKSTLREGLIVEYLLNGNAEDSGPLAINGVAFGAAPTANRKNVPNSAYCFDGVDDNITIANNSNLNFGKDDNYSISLWVALGKKQTDMSGSINDILDKWNGDTQGYPFGVRFWNSTAPTVDKNRITFVRYDGSLCSNISKQNSSVISDDAYHHLVQVKSGNSLKLYLDKNLISEMSDVMSCTTTNNSPITIGMRGLSARYFTGKIDDIRFYNRSINESEIIGLFSE